MPKSSAVAQVATQCVAFCALPCFACEALSQQECAHHENEDGAFERSACNVFPHALCMCTALAACIAIYWWFRASASLPLSVARRVAQCCGLLCCVVLGRRLYDGQCFSAALMLQRHFWILVSLSAIMVCASRDTVGAGQRWQAGGHHRC